MLINITEEGVPYYFPRRVDDVRSHIEAIIANLEEEDPPYDPRTQLNTEASKLYWGSKEDKKEYNKRLRRYDVLLQSPLEARTYTTTSLILVIPCRAVQRSMDYA